MSNCEIRVSVRNQDGGSTICAPSPAVTLLLQEYIISQNGRVYVPDNYTYNNLMNFSMVVQPTVNCLKVTKELAVKLLLSCQDRNDNDAVQSVLDRISIKCCKHHFVALECPAAPEKDATIFAFKQYGEIVGYTKNNTGGSRFLLTRKNLKEMDEIPQSYRMRIIDGVQELARLAPQDLELYSKAPKVSLKRPMAAAAAMFNGTQRDFLGEYYGGQSASSRPRLMEDQVLLPSSPTVQEVHQPEISEDFHEALLRKSQMQTDHQQPVPSNNGHVQQIPSRSTAPTVALIKEPIGRQPTGGGSQKIKHLMKFRVSKATNDPCSDFEDDFKKWLDSTDHHRQYDVKWPKKIGPGPSGRIEVEIDFEFRSCQSMIKTAQELAMASYFVDTFKISFMFRAFKITTDDMFDDAELEDAFIVVQDEEGQAASDDDGYQSVILRGNSLPRHVQVIEEMFLDPATSRSVLQREMKRIKEHESSVYNIEDDE